MKKKIMALLLIMILILANSIIALATEITEDELEIQDNSTVEIAEDKTEIQDNSTIEELGMTTIEALKNSTDEKDIDNIINEQEKANDLQTESLEKQDNNEVEEALASFADTHPIIEFIPTNSIGQAKPLIDEDSKIVMEAIGAEWSMSLEGVGGSDNLISSSSAFSVDWSKSSFQMQDIWGSDVVGYWFERDSSDKLVLKNFIGGYMRRVKGNNGNKMVTGSDSYLGWNFFEPATTAYEYKEYYTPDFGGRIPDLIEIKAWYNPTDFDEYGLMTEGSWTGKAFIVDKEKSVFHFKEFSNSNQLRIVPEVTDNIYTIGSGGGATITCTGELKDFINVLVDGNEVDRSNYTLSEGSTILTFTSKYLDTLSVGQHNVTLNYTYGSIDTKLTILATEAMAEATSGTENYTSTISSNPYAAQTGDINAISLYSLAGLLSAGGIYLMARKKFAR